MNILFPFKWSYSSSYATRALSSLNQTPIFEWYVVRCGSKIEYETIMYLKEIGLCA